MLESADIKHLFTQLEVLTLIDGLSRAPNSFPPEDTSTRISTRAGAPAISK